MFGHEAPPPLKAQWIGEETAVPLDFFAALTLCNHGYPVAWKGNPTRAGKGGLSTAWMTLAAPPVKLISAHKPEPTNPA